MGATDVPTKSVVAEEAPLGVLLWPVRAPQYEPNFTLAEVQVVRREHGSFVRWVYQSGSERLFGLGEEVAVLAASS